MTVSEFFTFVGQLMGMELAAWLSVAIAFVIGFFLAKLLARVFSHPLLVGLGFVFSVAFAWKALVESVRMPNVGNIAGLAFVLGMLIAIGIKACRRLNGDVMRK